VFQALLPLLLLTACGTEIPTPPVIQTQALRPLVTPDAGQGFLDECPPDASLVNGRRAGFDEVATYANKETDIADDCREALQKVVHVATTVPGAVNPQVTPATH
jgi:hypothetical protein